MTSLPSDDELRALVREAIAKRTGQLATHLAATGRGEFGSHSSHARYHLVNAGESCLIEPSVLCNHCGYCKSHGH